MWGAVDPVAGPYAETLTSLVRDGGQLVAYSRLGGMTAHVGISDLLYRRVTVRRGVRPSPSWCCHARIDCTAMIAVAGCYAFLPSNQSIMLLAKTCS